MQRTQRQVKHKRPAESRTAKGGNTHGRTVRHEHERTALAQGHAGHHHG